MVPSKVILVRHGETEWNHEGRFLGQSNPGLNDNGRIQAQAIALQLSSTNIDVIFSSDLDRAVQTSEAIAQACKARISMVPALREINFGAWEGLTFEEIAARYPVLWNEWLKDPFQVRIPDGETAEEVRCRVIQAWNCMVDNACTPKTAVIVAHGGPLRLLICHLLGILPSRQWEFQLQHGGLMVLEQNGDKYMHISNKDRKSATIPKK